MKLPASPREITPEWLTAALRAGGAQRLRRVEAVTWEPIGDDRGFTGVIAHLHVRYGQVDALGDLVELAGDGRHPPTLIAKFPTAARSAPSLYRGSHQLDPAQLRAQYQRAAREVLFYRDVALDMAASGWMSVPRLYYGAADEAAGRVVLLIEDVHDAQVGDVLRGCTLAQAEMALRAIAPLHARWWAHDTTEAFPWLPIWAGDIHARQERYNQQLGPFLKRFGQRIEPPLHDLLIRLRSGYTAVLNRLAAAPTALIHADLHLDNILFSPPSARVPVILLDWQGISRGPAAVDLALFLVGSLSVGQRRAHAHRLLRSYHAALVAQGVSGYTVEHLQDHWRLAMLWNLAGIVGWLSSADWERAEGRERTLLEAALGDGRLIAALLDEDVASLLHPTRP
jgi:thiamine kinase-like enzyme